MVRNHSRFADARSMNISTLRKLIGANTFVGGLELHRLDCIASNTSLTTYDYLRGQLLRFQSEAVLPPPLLNGQDLMSLGVARGPEIGKWLKLAYDRQLEGVHSDKEALLRWLKKKISKK